MKLFTIMQTAFENYDTSIQTYLTRVLGEVGMEYSNNQIFGIIFNGMKGIMENVMFYIEDALTEQNIQTATRKKSIYSLAKISGYEPYYGSAAVGTLLGTSKIASGYAHTYQKKASAKIYIKNGSKVVNLQTGQKYTIILPTDYYTFDITKPLVQHQFKIVQGVWISNSYVASGFLNETIEINGGALFDKDYFEVTVNGKKWSQAACFYDMTGGSEEYIITTGYDNTFNVSFGNGIYGKVVPAGSTIIIRYISHGGTVGNVNPSDMTRFQFEDTGLDLLNNSININEFMTLKMSNCISGGTNSDTIDFVRSMIGYNTRSLVLATEDSFKLFLKRFSFIGPVNIWSEDNSMTISICALTDMYNKIATTDDYFNVKENELMLNEDQKSMIIASLNNSNYALAGVSVKFREPIIRKFAIVCFVKVDTLYNRDSAKQSIKETIAKYFMNLPNGTDFIPKSAIIKTVLDNNDKIESFDCNIISEMAEKSFYDGYYYQYELKFINNTYQYHKVKVLYDSSETPGLDRYGNIKLNAKMEIPMLRGGWNYYPNKDSRSLANRNNSLMMETFQIFFI